MNKRIIEVVNFDKNWAKAFEIEKMALAKVLGSNAVKIEHIGSTSVSGLAAKPVIDILIEVLNVEALDEFDKEFIALGYTIKGENGISGRRYFQKGGNQRSHHVHAFQSNDIHLLRHRAFKAYLVAHSEVALEYGLIKTEAVSKSDNDINVYMALKNDFIQKHEQLALNWFTH
ncbi:MAG: GrpB family protein [Colwellia sp.]|nr:GrpB family protein [Colwellia sp.]